MYKRVRSQRRVKAAIKTQTAVVCVQSVAQTVTIHKIGQDSHWEQFGTAHTLINAIHWVHGSCGALSWFDRLEKKPSVKVINWISVVVPTWTVFPGPVTYVCIYVFCISHKV